MKKQHEDCWNPLPGSWEEHVEPYDLPRARKDSRHTSEEQQRLPLEIFPESLQQSTFAQPLTT